MPMSPVNNAIKKKSRLTKDEWREYTKTVWQIANTTHAEHPAVFPVEIPRRLIKLFSWHGETVLDPFAGAGTTAEAAVPLGRKVLCIDQSRKYVGIIQRDCSHLKNGNLTSAELMNVVHGDSRDISFVEDDSVSLVVSSPPYWNKANYGTARANLGRVAGYRRFLDKIRPVFEECFRILQPGRKCCLVTANVNQHTRSRTPDLPACGRLRGHPARHRLRDGDRDHLVEGWHRRPMGFSERATPYLRELPISTELSFQERSRVHPRLLETSGEKIKGSQGRTVRRTHG